MIENRMVTRATHELIICRSGDLTSAELDHEAAAQGGFAEAPFNVLPGRNSFSW